VTDQPDDGVPAWGKPLSQRSREELDELRRQLHRRPREINAPRREAKVRRGLVKPQNLAEWEQFGMYWRTARSEDRQSRR
jgi:hypothetical protein